MTYVFKNIRLVVCILYVCVSSFHLVEAAPAREENILKVGYVLNTGFVEENWTGHYSGYGYEYMESLAMYGHWTFEYIPYKSWMELGAALQNGDVDLIPCMPGDYRLFKNTVRTDHVIGRFPMALVVNDLNIKPEMKIGNIPDNYPVPTLPIIAENEGFSYKTVMYPGYYEMIDGFNNGEIDGYIDAMIQPRRMKNLLSIFDRQSYRLLVSSRNTELLEQLNRAMDHMLLYQPNIRDRLNNKYLRLGGFPLALNRQEREYLQEHNKLKAAIFIQEKPYAYFEDGKAKGAIPEIIKRISDDLGIEIEIVPTKSVVETRELIKEGKIDIAADAICDYSEVEKYNVKLTQPYFKISYVPVKRSDSEEGDPNKVACVTDFLYTKTFLEPHFPKEKLLYFSTLEDCFKAVSDGKADVVFAPRNEVPYLIDKTDTFNLETNSESYFYDEICIGVYKNSDPRLWHILNKEVNHLDSDWVRSIVSKKQDVVVHVTPKWFIYHHPAKVVALVIIISWIIGGIIVYRNRMRRKHIEVIQHMAYTDARYNLPNIAWLESQMPELLSKRRAKPSTKNIYVAVLAMESRAAIVAQYGEELLIKHMQRASKQLNEKNWVIMTAAGVGSNNLVCVCQAESDAQISEYVSEALADYSYIETKDSKIWLHMKAGICEYRMSDFSVLQVVEKANAAYAESSLNDVRIFDDRLQEDLTLKHKIESHMEKALADGEFKAWYQPKYDIKTRRIIGAEALVRWISADMGFMPPGKFIPLFEQNGFVIPVDYSILEQTFQLQKKRLSEGKEVVPISVNQSRLHMTEEGYLDKIKAIIDKYKLSPTGLIELEVTETVFGDFDEKTNQKRAADIISKLHEMGFTISVDDFGSGYSSFMMLNYLPMDVMKIDRSLLNASGDSERMKNILGNVIKLGRTLNMQVICEGIETREQEELLLELGCHYGQGFLNAKPMPVDDFIKFFEKRNSEVA